MRFVIYNNDKLDDFYKKVDDKAIILDTSYYLGTENLKQIAKYLKALKKETCIKLLSLLNVKVSNIVYTNTSLEIQLKNQEWIMLAELSRTQLFILTILMLQNTSPELHYIAFNQIETILEPLRGWFLQTVLKGKGDNGVLVAELEWKFNKYIPEELIEYV